jgi:hypothetical protein
MNAVVCYPYIVPNSHWLMTAALCWDHVYRMTSHEAPEDPPALVALTSELEGFLREVYPDQFQPELTDETVLEWATPSASNNSSDGPEMFPLFRDKMSPSLLHVFQAHGLAARDVQEVKAPWWMEELYSGDRGEYVKNNNWRPSNASAAAAKAKYDGYRREARARAEAGDITAAAVFEEKADRLYAKQMRTFSVPGQKILVRRDVAMNYMSAAAKKAALNLNADLFGEDQQSAHVAMDVSSARAQVAVQTLDAYLPKNLVTLSGKQLADLRNEMALERVRFQSAVHALVGEFATISSDRDLKSLEARIVDAARERVDATYRAYRRAKLQAAVASFGVGLTPAALAQGLASLLSVGIFAPAAIVASLAAFGAKALLDVEKARSDHDSAAWSYVLKIAKNAS